MTKKLTNKFPTFLRRAPPKHQQEHSPEDMNDADPNREARELATHSRLEWSPSEPNSALAASLRGKITTARGDVFDVEEDHEWHVERRKVHRVFRESDGSSLVGSIRDEPRSPSPAEGHEGAVETQNEGPVYAHYAWTPPKGEATAVSEEEDVEKKRRGIRAIIERCRDMVKCGQFEEAAVGQYFRKSYCYRTTPEEQEAASRSFVRIVDARARIKKRRFEEAKKERLEEEQRVRRAKEEAVRAEAAEYRVELNHGGSDFGDFVEELWRQVVVPNFL